ncbi:MAG: hypothetical protein PVF58_00525 [Candidatus Methanofastidiosia archaeon]|jgi:uncharacterized protein YwgA
MFEKYAKLALAVSMCDGQVNGRKKLQKMIHITKVLGYPFKERFTLYWYGPYSQELAGELKRMDELNILDETKPDYSYQIKLTETGKKFLIDSESTISDETGTEIFNNMKALLKDLNKLNAWQLEILATLFYFNEIEQRDIETLKKATKKIKPKFDDKDVDIMAKKMQELIEKYLV